MDVLEAPATVDQLSRQPVENVWVRGLLSRKTKIVRRTHQALAHIVLPDAIDDHPRRQRILWAGNPFCKLETSLGTLGFGRGSVQLSKQVGNQSQHGWDHFFEWPLAITVLQEMERGRGLGDIGPSQNLLRIELIVRRPPQPLAVPCLYRPRPKDRRHAVIVKLRNRIEFMIVTAGTLDGHPQEGRGGRMHEIFQPFKGVVLGIVGFVVPRP